MPTHAHRTLRNTGHLIGFDEKPTAKPTEKFSVDRETFGFSFGFIRFKPIETDRRFGDKPKNRPSHFSLSVHNTGDNTHYGIYVPSTVFGCYRSSRLYS